MVNTWQQRVKCEQPEDLYLVSSWESHEMLSYLLRPHSASLWKSFRSLQPGLCKNQHPKCSIDGNTIPPTDGVCTHMWILPPAISSLIYISWNTVLEHKEPRRPNHRCTKNKILIPVWLMFWLQREYATLHHEALPYCSVRTAPWFCCTRIPLLTGKKIFLTENKAEDNSSFQKLSALFTVSHIHSKRPWPCTDQGLSADTQKILRISVFPGDTTSDLLEGNCMSKASWAQTRG